MDYSTTMHIQNIYKYLNCISKKINNNINLKNLEIDHLKTNSIQVGTGTTYLDGHSIHNSSGSINIKDNNIISTSFATDNHHVITKKDLDNDIQSVISNATNVYEDAVYNVGIDNTSCTVFIVNDRDNKVILSLTLCK